MAALDADPDVDDLRAQARELHRRVEAGDADALARVPPEVLSAGPFTLAAAELALAREHGFADWERLEHYVQIVTSRAWNPDAPAPADESPADRFLRAACLTGDGDQAADRAAAMRLLADHPDLPDRDPWVAAACAHEDALARQLAAAPDAATATGGPHDWSPLLYLAYARHDPDVDLGATLRSTRRLLEAGADPNDGRFWHALPTPFTVLTGVLGGGEDSRPGHAHAIALARLLLDAGADPNDGQALYNRMFGTDDSHLVLLFEFGLGRDTNGPWHRLLGDSLESPAETLRCLLAWAVTHDQRHRVALLADNGVDVVSAFTENRSPRGRTPIEVALANGHRHLADDLRDLGAAPPRVRPGDRFVGAVLAGDADAVRQTPDAVIARVRQKRTGLMPWAAAVGRPGAIGLLVAAGFDVNALGRGDIPGNQQWQTALHVAAEKGDADLARALLALGADPNIRDTRFRATPLGWAQYFHHPALIELLEPITEAE